MASDKNSRTEDAAKALSPRFIQGLLSSGSMPETKGKEPVLQIVHLSEMKNDKTRWKVAFSDGTTAVQGMLAQQCTPQAESGELQNGGIVRLKEFTTNVIGDKSLKAKWIFIALQVEALSEYGVCNKIGNPTIIGPAPPELLSPAISGQGFYGNAQKQEPAAKQSLPSRSMAVSQHGRIYPIEAISPYQTKWTIKARVTSKSPVKEWHNDRGAGKLFSFNLLDESGEIRATAFGNQCDAYFDMIEEGGVYYLSSPCTVKMAQRKFNNLNNEYELTLERETVIEKAEDQQDVPQIRYNFTRLADLSQVEKDAVVDTIGVLTEVGKVDQITSKTSGKPYHKRELLIVDDTDFSVRLTIWGNAAHEFDVPVQQVIAFKGAKVSDFGNRSLSLLSSGTMAVNPDVDDAHRLKGWYDAQGQSTDFRAQDSLRQANAGPMSNTPAKTIEQLKAEQIGMSGKAEYFDLKATTVYFSPQKFAYEACPSPPDQKCNKKVTQDTDGTWRCDNCGFTAPEPQYRYILNLSVSDFTGQCRMSCFDDIGQKIMGMDAKKLTELKESSQNGDVQAWADATWNTYMLRCRAQVETYQDDERVRYTIVAANPVDFVKDSSRLAELIASYD